MPEHNENINPMSNNNATIENDQLSNYVDPGGICCFEKCLTIGHRESVDRKIYFGTPLCAGMVRVTCSNSLYPCILNFHMKCWSAKKDMCWPDRKMSEKEISQTAICFTPSCVNGDGCSSFVDKIEIIDSNGKIIAVKQHENNTTKHGKVTTSKEVKKPPIQKQQKAKTPNKPRPLVTPNSQTTSNETPKTVKNENVESLFNKEMLNYNKRKLVKLRAENFGIQKDNKWVPSLPMYGNEFMVATANALTTPDYSKDSAEVAAAKTSCFEYFYRLISNCGPLKLDDLLTKYLEAHKGFVSDIHEKVLTHHSNLGEFLAQSLKLTIIDDYICTMEQLPIAYSLIKEQVVSSLKDITYGEEIDENSTKVNDFDAEPNFNVTSMFKKKNSIIYNWQQHKNEILDQEDKSQEEENVPNHVEAFSTSSDVDEKLNTDGADMMESVRGFARKIEKQLQMSRMVKSTDDIVSALQTTVKKPVNYNDYESTTKYLRKLSLGIEDETNSEISLANSLCSGSKSDLDVDPNRVIEELKNELSRAQNEIKIAKFELNESKKMNVATKGRLLKKILCAQYVYNKQLISTKMCEIQKDLELITFIQKCMVRLTGRALSINESTLQQSIAKLKQISDTHESRFLRIEDQLRVTSHIGNPMEIDLQPEVIPELPKYPLIDVIRSAFDMLELKIIEENSAQSNVSAHPKHSSNSGHYHMNSFLPTPLNLSPTLSSNFHPHMQYPQGFYPRPPPPPPLVYPVPTPSSAQSFFHGQPFQRFPNQLVNTLGAIPPLFTVPQASRAHVANQHSQSVNSNAKNNTDDGKMSKSSNDLLSDFGSKESLIDRNLNNNVYQSTIINEPIEKTVANEETLSNQTQAQESPKILPQTESPKILPETESPKHKKPKNASLDRLMHKMRLKYPGVLELDLLKSIICVRKQHNNSLTSMTMKQIMYEAYKFISHLQREQLCSYTQYKPYVPPASSTDRNQGFWSIYDTENKSHNLSASTSSLVSTASNSSTKRQAPSESLTLKKCWLTLNAPNEKWDSNKVSECSICCEELSNSEAHSLPCKHTYHKECIEKWYQTNMNESIYRSCPECRHPFIDDQEYPPLMQS